ncbi:hypothetical protein ABI59_03340 [Acidobacteria bacterium Mor1]|nr:hypothetical protein ABI59_03340 [Acidobacteria bacterium Mor1]
MGNVRYEVRDRVAWITIDRPKKLNALNRQTVGEIACAVEKANADDGVGVLVLTGSGEKAFVAGADIAEMSALDATRGQEFSRFLHASLDRVERSPKPVIAAINGFALGGGCELAQACHVRICSDNARFGQPEVNLGLIPGAGGSQRLPRIVGRGRALDLILSGEMIGAEEALRIGLVTKVVPAEELGGTVAKYAATLNERSPIALARSLDAVLTGTESSLEDGLRLEAALFGLSFATEDMKEGTQAFIEKRKPEYKGR